MTFEPPPVVSEAPALTQMPISGADRNGRMSLGVLAKRTYLVGPDGRCHLAPEQLPLNYGVVEDPDNPECILAEPDLFLDKLETDVVVRGHAWNHAGAPAFYAGVQVHRYPAKQVAVFGERKLIKTATGRIAFSEPTVLDKVPLSYAYAYGGVDERAEREWGSTVEAMGDQLDPETRDLVLSAASPWRYPRNRGGKGYLVDDHPESLDALELPNLEDPHDLLSGDRIIVRDPWYWPLLPIPASFDWLDGGNFPRMGYFGQTPEWAEDDLTQYVDAFPEVRYGYADRKIFFYPPNLLDIPKHFDRRALNGASMGLRFPYLGGGETITTANLHPQLPNWSVRLPGERPTLWVDDRAGGLNELRPQLYTVVLEPDEGRLTLLWVGFGPAKRQYFEHELLAMPMLVEW
ncbi:hypothetical protein PPSIR1_14215 [Plesiocystis pacifica SIR-1]|uniref:DUF2169 domain-containing protein n=1 Tax=Plesiocystis pacifica SIR-1 TaxID=391625 RepID=A6GJN8_9BACT|nr:DUF2169 domain-containing protein [Plesiocystis pacifica]EDM73923.1 hypothetical protein PPSIR1_14215 [Plesiocystis pacifica SIR-1]